MAVSKSKNKKEYGIPATIFVAVFGLLLTIASYFIFNYVTGYTKVINTLETFICETEYACILTYKSTGILHKLDDDSIEIESSLSTTLPFIKVKKIFSATEYAVIAENEAARIVDLADNSCIEFRYTKNLNFELESEPDSGNYEYLILIKECGFDSVEGEYDRMDTFRYYSPNFYEIEPSQE